MATHLRDFTFINSPMFLRSRAYEDPQNLLYQFQKILYSMGENSIEKDEFVAINSNMWPKLGTHNGEIIGH